MSTVIVQPLLPPITSLDIILPPLLIALSLFLHLISHPSKSVGEIYLAKTAHARFLPIEAKHTFNYSVLFFGIWLDDFKKSGKSLGESELGRWFGWSGDRYWRLTSFWIGDYLNSSINKTTERSDEQESLKSKLNEIIEGGLGDDRRVYFISMPAYFGFRGINPLSIYFVYKPFQESVNDIEENEKGPVDGEKVGEMEMVVLEVHNTFGERHIYVLKVGFEEDDLVQKGFTNQWTFPRSFHVSPFNDRSGFYTISLSSPFLDPTSPSVLNLKIVFLTEKKEKKLYASLIGSSKPLNESNLISSLVRFPFSLFLTSLRILYQAGKLHFSKRLLVFPRPEPFVEEFGIVENPVGKGAKQGSVGWQEISGFSLEVKELVMKYLGRRVTELDNFMVVFRAAGRKGEEIVVGNGNKKLIIDYSTEEFWIDFISFPSFSYCLEIGSEQQHRFKVSNRELFLEIFDNHASASREGWKRSLLLILKQNQLEWETSFSSIAPAKLITISTNPIISIPSISFLINLTLHHFVIRLGYWIFLLVGAKFVPGRETWNEWKLFLEKDGSNEGQQGIVVDGSALDSVH